MLQQYLISIDARLTLEKLDCLRTGGDSRVSGCTRRDANIHVKESRLFIYIFYGGVERPNKKRYFFRSEDLVKRSNK